MPCGLPSTVIKSRSVTLACRRTKHCVFNHYISLVVCVYMCVSPCLPSCCDSRGLLTSDSSSQIIPRQSNRVLLDLSSRGRNSTAKTCFVLFNLVHRDCKPTVTLSFVDDTAGLPCGPNVRLHYAVLVIHPKYRSLGSSNCHGIKKTLLPHMVYKFYCKCKSMFELIVR